MLSTGDVVLVHGTHFTSRLIQFGQALRGRRKHAHWTHAALVLNPRGDLAEALSRGVVKTNISKYEGADCIVIRANATVGDWSEIRRFAQSVLRSRERYGYLTLVSLFFTLTLGSKFVFGKVGTAICSGFVAEALTRSGHIFPKPPAYMTPADLAEHFGL